MASDQRPSLVEALSRYFVTLKDRERRDAQQELNRFMQWCGRDRPIDELTPSEIAEYGDSASVWGTDSARKLKPVKSFLTYLNKRGLTVASLSPHLKVSKAKRGPRRVYPQSVTERAELSSEGYANLQSRLEMFRGERIRVVADIGRAMADKDFKENAPLDAAKERQGLIESGIRDLEAILANAVMTQAEPVAHDPRVRIGRRVTLRDVNSRKEVRYTLVDSSEANPVAGKISSVSPVGKALLDKAIGEEVHISVPSGTLHYIIEKVEA